MTYLVDNPATIFFTAFMSLWGKEEEEEEEEEEKEEEEEEEEELVVITIILKKNSPFFTHINYFITFFTIFYPF